MSNAVSLPSLDQVLHETFGLSDFREKQKEVIESIMNRQHTLALLPTGYGKSLCYQVPSQVLNGVTVVVSPLIALMQDQVSGLVRRGINNVTLLNSSIDAEERDGRMDGILIGEYKLVYVAPERFESPRFRQLLSDVEVSLLVIDEAHCISQWGHDFRPHYRNLSAHLAHIRGATILALTATATPAVQADIVRSLRLEDMRLVIGNLDRANLRFEARECQNNFAKDKNVSSLLKENGSPAIVYTSSRKDAEAVAARLKESGVPATYYHAGMTRDARFAAQRAFENGQVSVIVCTVAFGMGIDKSNVRQVIHYSLPGSLESYYQEAGRAGRDGKEAACTLLFANRDIAVQEFLIDRNYPSANAVNEVLQFIRSQAPGGVRSSEIMESVTIEESALNSALGHLKLLELVTNNHQGFTSTAAAAADTDVSMELLDLRKSRDSERLQRMIQYAKSYRCRPQQILEYFGQEHASGRCGSCDACSGKQRHSCSHDSVISKTVKQAAVTANAGRNCDAIILQLVQELDGRVGRTTVAQVLAGSRAKKIKEKDLHRSEFYGKLTSLPESKILSTLDDLIAAGQVRVTRGLYPKVHITETGQARVSG